MASLPAVDAALSPADMPRPAPRLLQVPGRALLVLLMLAAVFAAMMLSQATRAPSSPVLQRPAKSMASSDASPDMTAVMAAPQAYKPLTPLDAQALNAARPLDARPLEVARPFILSAEGAEWEKAANCLALANYYEAASEGDGGMRAVSQVVLNRMRHPIFPHSVCGVVFQGAERATGCQFTFTCDGSMSRPPNAALFARARAVAEAALRGRVEATVGMSTHYHANFVVPYWADSLDKVRTLGSHIFYVWRGPGGNRAAFRSVYSGEPQDAGVPVVMPLPVAGADEIGGPASALALTADRITLGPRPQGGKAPARAYLVADEGKSALKADEHETTGTLRAQPLLARSPERVMSDDR